MAAEHPKLKRAFADPHMDAVDALLEQAQQARQAGQIIEACTLATAAIRLGSRTIKDGATMRQLVTENALLKSKAMTDKLTGLPNRDGVMAALAERIQNIKSCNDNNKMANGNNIETAVIFIDLDGFKAVNDALGHEAGDDALREVSKRLLGRFNRQDDVVAKGRSFDTEAEDTVGRLGGDELILLISYNYGRHLDKEAVRKMIRSTLGGLVYFDKNNKPYPVGASIGISSFTKNDLDLKLTDENNMLAFIKKADEAMYFDKWYEGKAENLPGGADDPHHPKNKRLKALVQQALENLNNSGGEDVPTII